MFAAGSNVMTVTADLRSKEQILRMKEKLEAHQMLPDIVVNNAGVSHYSLLSDVSEEDWDYIMNVNLKGTFLCSQIFMEKMVKRKYGRIINVSSIWGITGAPAKSHIPPPRAGSTRLRKRWPKSWRLRVLP